MVDDVVTERQAGNNAAYFTALHAAWRLRVADYLLHNGSPAQVQTWPQIDAHKGRFQRLYTHPKEGSAQGLIIKAMRDHGLDLCPACGEPGAPNTLDHYLPKGKFPHFAVTPANLFPMCDACQSAKLEQTGSATVPRFFIHPYFDTFSIPQIAKLSIDAPFEAPTFNLSTHPNLQPLETALVASHLNKLEIAERYIVFFKNEHRRLLRLVSRMRNSNQDVAQTLEDFRFNAADPTPNSWQHLFYNGVLENAAMMDYLINQPLPALP